MPLETHPHIIAVTIFFLALITVFFVRDLRDPSGITTLICGILLVGLGAWAFNGFGIMGDFFEALHGAKKMDDERFQQAKHATSLWAVMLPAVVAAMGANLITSWALLRTTQQ